jgi:spore maturation protein CgeB
MRLNVLRNLGHTVVPVDIDPTASFKNGHASLVSRIARKVGYPLDKAGANDGLITNAKRGQFDCIWIDKGLSIKRSTLEKLKQLQPKSVLIGYSPDDMYQRFNQSVYFLKGLPLYDVYFTTKTYNVPELTSMGARRVYFVGNAYDPNVHRPISIDASTRKEFGGTVGFVGAYEKERAECILALARSGIQVRVWGWTDWSCMKDLHPNAIIENRGVWGDEYTKALNSFDINLCFLRKANRDLQTTRTIEIPACRAFMLAERTAEHQSLFREDVEAVYFDSSHELVAKCHYYLREPGKREAIAAAGYKRCLTDGYDYPSRLRSILELAMNRESIIG